MNRSYLLTGSNLGNKEDHLARAHALLQEHCGEISKTSALYETAAWGMEQQPSFLNQALELQTELNARQLIRRILKIEKMMGRVRKEKYGPRIIDIDILLFNDEKHHYHFLKVPHPELPNRRFALLPLAEIAAEIIHPTLHKTVSELLDSCSDPLPVKKLS